MGALFLVQLNVSSACIQHHAMPPGAQSIAVSVLLRGRLAYGVAVAVARVLCVFVSDAACGVCERPSLGTVGMRLVHPDETL